MMPEYNPTEWIIICVYLSFLSILGTAGNALVLVVFYRKKDKQVSTFFIIVLAIVDFTTCLILIPCTLFMEYWDFRISHDFICKSYMMLNGGMIHFSALIMVAIALERYFSICHPFLRVLTLNRAKCILVGLASVASVLGICIALTHGVVKNLWLNILTSTAHTTNFPISNISEKEVLIKYTNDIRAGVSTEYTINTLVSLQNGTMATKELEEQESCQPNDLVLSHEFQIHFQRLSNTLYLVYLAIVIILYALIYKSVMTRRARRQKQKSACLIQVRQAQEKAKMAERIAATVHANAINLHGMLDKDRGTVKDGSVENNTCLEYTNMVGATTLVTQARIEEEPTTLVDNQQLKQQQPQQQKHHQSRRQRQKNKKQMVDGTMLANMKTAAMLFVVTVIFFVTFTPAFLSAVGLIDFKAYLFYLYFANNVANPIIYSFMNRNFRTDLKKLFCNKVD